MFPITKILVPVDFSRLSIHAARLAVPVAQRFQCQIILLHVLPLDIELGSAQFGAALLGDLVAQRRKQAERGIAEFLREELAHFQVQRLLIEGDPAREIVDCARREQAGLIMMPTHGYGPFRRMLLGSVTAKVLHDAGCPVWTTTHVETPAGDPTLVKRVFCAIDRGPRSAHTLEWSAGLAAEFNAQLTLVHALVELDARTEGYHFSPEWRKFLVDAAQAEIAALQAKAGTQAEVILTKGPAAETICEEARRAAADLLVVGRSADAAILGGLTSDAYSIIRQSPCPVVSV